MAFMKHSEKDEHVSAVTLTSCCIGEVVSLDQLPDEIFPSRFLGEGFCMLPSEYEFVCPVSGEVKDVSESGLDITIKTSGSLLIIISLGCRGGEKPEAEVSVKSGDIVSAGSELWKTNENSSLIALVIVTNCPDDSYDIRYGKVKHLGQPVMTINI